MLTRRQSLGLLAAGLPALHLRAKAAPSLAPKPLVFAHRGASALRPEHTLASYARAMMDGPDFIEPALVMTRAGHLVLRPQRHTGGPTDGSARHGRAPRVERR